MAMLQCQHMSYEYPRTELLTTVVFGESMRLDGNPFETAAGRIIPGTVFAAQELESLRVVATFGTAVPVPSVAQLSRITINAVSGCWELPIYDDPRNRARYGQLSVRGIANVSGLAHITMYGVFYGPDAAGTAQGMMLDHLCLNKACCYPRHLEPVTPGENTRRGRLRYVAGQAALF
jgi:hypothetical protein